jgi:hypothetical protein
MGNCCKAVTHNEPHKARPKKWNEGFKPVNKEIEVL